MISSKTVPSFLTRRHVGGITKAGLLALALGLSACSGEDPVELTEQYLERAQVYQEQGQYKASMIEFRNAIKKSPNPDESLLRYAQMLNDLGRFSPARDVLAQIKNKENAEVLLEDVESLIGLNKFRSAGEVLESTVVASDVDYADLAKLYSATVHAGQSRLGDAEAAYISLFSSKDSEIAAGARVGAAKVQATQSRYDEAMSNVEQVEQSSEQFIEAQVIKAGIQIVRGELEAAESILSDSLASLPSTDLMLPQRAVVLERLSYVLTRLGRSNEAFIYQKILADAFPGATDLSDKYQQALASFKNKDYVKATAELNNILDEYPLYDRAKQLLGIIYYTQGDTSKASELLSDSVDPEVADPVVRHVYAATNLKLNDPQKVLEILGPELAATQTPETLVLYALAAISDGKLTEGESALKKALELAPGDPKIRLSLANFYRQVNRIEEQRAQLNEALRLDSTDKQVLAALVSYYARNESTASAENFVETALKKNPNVYATNLIAGYFYAATKRVEKSLGYFEKSLQFKVLPEESIDALLAKGRAQFVLSRYDDAEKSYLDVIDLDASNVNAYAGLLEVFRTTDVDQAYEKVEVFAKRNAVVQPYLVLIQDSIQQGQLEKAAIYVERAQSMKLLPAKVSELAQSLKYAQALQAVNVGEFDQARAIVADLLGEVSGNIRLLTFLVELELRDGKVQEAAKVLGQIETINRSHPVVPILKSDIAVASGKIDEAKSLLEKAWSSAPNEILADKLYKLYSQMNDNTARVSHLEEWERFFPNAPKPILIQAMTFQQRGQRVKATEYYEKLLSISPNEVMALNNLGWIYFEKGDDRSIPLLKRAANLAPNSADVLDSLGWVLYKNGDVKEGREYLKRATELAPNNDQIKAHYIEATQ